MLKFFLHWGPVIIWAGLIFLISSFPTLPHVGFIWWDFVLKKSAHIIEYIIFYFLLIRALNPTSAKQILPTKINPETWTFALIIAILYACSDEIHQSFVPGRTCKVTDVGFDTFGMLISQQLIKRHAGKKLHTPQR